MPQTPVSLDRIAELLVQIGRTARAEDSGSDLTAAQWTCLRFFARANRPSRTPSAFASFHATTRGTASQIVKALEEKGLILRHRSDTDGRSVFFELTAAGRAMLARDPLSDLTAALAALDPGTHSGLLDTLSQLTEALARLRSAPSFGTCSDCTHFAALGGAGYCACMAAELAEDEIGKLCQSFRAQAARAAENGPPALLTEKERPAR